MQAEECEFRPMGRREAKGFSSRGVTTTGLHRVRETFCLEFSSLFPLPTVQLGNVLELVLAQN